jgi:hypothetical protein
MDRIAFLPFATLADRRVAGAPVGVGTRPARPLDFGLIYIAATVVHPRAASVAYRNHQIPRVVVVCGAGINRRRKS